MTHAPSELNHAAPRGRAFYNERDPFAAQWLRNLIAAGHIAPGIVDERSITEISPDDLRGFAQCHFFAGIGVWSHALRRAGWADDVLVWTGSCPCQPFSAAGKQKRFDDDRHLWPIWFELIRECRPAVVLGEQVASALDWLDLVSADLERTDYAFGASDLCAAGFGGAHIRQRLYFVALADPNLQHKRPAWAHAAGHRDISGSLQVVRLADADGRHASAEWEQRGGQHGREPQDGGAMRGGNIGPRPETDLWVAQPGSERRERGQASTPRHDHDRQASERPQGQHGFGEPSAYRLREDGADATLLGRNPADWLYCRDGKWRPVEPGTFPLADAAPARVGRLRAYGNALDAETAAQFCGAVADILFANPAHIDPPFQAPRRNLDGGQALPSNFFNDPRCDAPDGLGAVGSRSFHAPGDRP